MNRRKIARGLLRIAAMVSSSSEEDAPSRSLVSFNVIRNPERIKSLMKKYGFALRDDGAFMFYPVTQIGQVDYSRKPMNAGGDPDKAVRSNQHIMDSNDEKVADYNALLDLLSALKRQLEPVRISPSPEEVAGALQSFDQALGEAKTGNKYMSPRFRGVRKEIGNELLGVRGDISEADFNGALGRFASIEEMVFNSLQGWQNQNAFFAERKKLVLALRNAMKKDRQEVVDVIWTIRA